MTFAGMMALALALDAVVGWPQRVYARIGHPVTWIGALIASLEASWNKGSAIRRRLLGAVCVLLVIGAVTVPTLVLQRALADAAWALVVGAVLAWPLIAARSLHDHVAAVAQPLGVGNMAGARTAVSMIVGRDPSQLDAAGVARAALESLAENTSDGVVAPLFWGAVAGLPGIAAYKAINTMDSMIGHRNARHEDFGKVAARLDDVVNWVPARLTALALALAGGRWAAFGVMRRDAGAHRSPNAGWPEAAMAGALGIRLSGPRIYADRVANEPWLNASARDPHSEDLDQGLVVYRRAMVLCGAALLALALI